MDHGIVVHNRHEAPAVLAVGDLATEVVVLNTLAPLDMAHPSGTVVDSVSVRNSINTKNVFVRNVLFVRTVSAVAERPVGWDI